MKKFLVLALTVATLVWAAPAKAAETITFDPDGIDDSLGTNTLDSIEMLTFDWSVGNSLLVEDPGGLTGTVYFQANLTAAFLDSGDILFTNGDEGNYFTAVAGYGVNITSGFIGTTAISVFTLDLDNDTNFFNIYHNDESASDLDGVCFVCGTLVLSAEAQDDSFDGFNGGFQVPNFVAQTGEPLDQSGDDDYPGVLTLIGSGVTNILLTTTFVDTNFFPTLDVNATFLTTNSSLINPYAQTDPSACFDSDGDFGSLGGDCDLLGATGVGPINGRDSRIVTQTDANSSFVTEQLEVVPEPTTLSLLGLGLLLGGAHLRRRAKKNA